MNSLMLGLWTIGTCSIAYWLARATRLARYERLLDNLEDDYLHITALLRSSERDRERLRTRNSALTSILDDSRKQT